MAPRTVNDDLFIADVLDPDLVRLRGTRCSDCGEVFFGRRIGCESCSSQRLAEFGLGTTGVLYSHTTLYATPPGDYLPHELFDPIQIGLVELPEGVRVLSPIVHGDVPMKVGAPVDLRLVDRETLGDTGELVVTYAFEVTGGPVVKEPS